eukprot:gene9484-10299_t
MMDDFSSMQTLNHQLSSLFLGDLSIYSTEKDIRQLFRNYGIIDTVRIKRGGSGKPHLSYGFIKFRDRESAELAMKDLNGTVFLGRALRIGWAEPKSNTKVIKPRKDVKHGETAQIHVSFISKQVDALITEATLRGLFSMYGEIVDVAIKKTQFDKKLRIQNGYGFVHYALTPEGVQSAITATKAIHQVTIDRVTYDCSLSHALEMIVGPEVAAEIYAPKPPQTTQVNLSTYENQGGVRNLMGSGNLSPPPPPELNTGFGAMANSIPKPPPITTVNQQLPPLPPHHYGHHHQSHNSGLPFPHEDLEKRGLKSFSPPGYSPSGSSPRAFSPSGGSASVLQSYYNNEYPAQNEFYGIADMKKSPRPTEYSAPLSAGGLSPYASHRNSHYQHSNASTSSASLSSYNDGLALSDSESEIPFERLSLTEGMSKPSPTNSLRSSENRTSVTGSLSNDRSPMYAHRGHMTSYGGANYSNYSYASNSMDSALSLSSISSNNSTFQRFDGTGSLVNSAPSPQLSSSSMSPGGQRNHLNNYNHMPVGPNWNR